MSKHSLIATGLGLGLMAASMGASAQVHTFDYSSMYYGATAGGSKYVSFVPTIVRGIASDSEGAAGVLMLELFQPVSGSASTWAFALGGVVGSDAGGAGTDAVDNASIFPFTANNGAAVGGFRYLGDVVSISHGFSQSVTVSSQACQVTFAAVIGTNDQLAFTSVAASPVSGVVAVGGGVSLTTGPTGAGSAYTLAANLWNNASATIVSSYATNTAMSMVGISSGGAATTLTGSAVNAALQARGKCVPAYTARASGGGTTITGETIGLVRIY